MKKRKTKKDLSKKCDLSKACCSRGGGIYFLGFIGAAVYYIQAADTFGQGVLGFLKAIVWPAFLIYKLLGM